MKKKEVKKVVYKSTTTGKEKYAKRMSRVKVSKRAVGTNHHVGKSK